MIRTPAPGQGCRIERSAARRRSVMSTSEIDLTSGRLAVHVVVDERADGTVRERIHVRHSDAVFIFDAADASTITAAISHASERAATWRRARRPA